MYRTDRKNKRGGGVCLLINDDVFHSIRVQTPTKYCHVEIVAVDIFVCEFKCRLIVAYRPPSSDHDQAAIQYCIEMSNCINDLCSKNMPLILMR